MPPFRHLALVVAIGLVVGCRPEIGDDCLSSVDCSQQGDRLCDTSQPDGYCTVFNCEPDKCPDEASCIGFGLTLDPVCSADADPRWPRFERTFCLKACETDDDCRVGYECVAAADRGAISIDLESENRNKKSCFQIAATSVTQTQAFDVCQPTSTVATITVGVGASSSQSSGSASSSSGGGEGGASSSSASSASSASSSASSASSSASSASGGGAGGN